MEIDRRLNSLWTVVVDEADVFNRFIDEAIQENTRRSAANVPSFKANTVLTFITTKPLSVFRAAKIR